MKIWCFPRKNVGGLFLAKFAEDVRMQASFYNECSGEKKKGGGRKRGVSD